jgi:hypothetical protein
LSQARPPRRLLHALGALQAFLAANNASLANDATHYRLESERISTAVVGSMVNRVIGRRLAKKQTMRGSRRGAHWRVQFRMAVLAGGLQDVFRHWHPRLALHAGEPGSHPRLTQHPAVLSTRNADLSFPFLMKV